MPRLPRLALMIAAALAAGTTGIALGQMEGTDRGVTPIDSSGSFEVSGVQVDVRAKDAEAARQGGWRLAQRKAWVTLSQRLGKGSGLVSDGTLDSIVSGIVIDNENIGPDRYIARLGVLFDRARTGALLGVALGGAHSPPILVMPVEWSGGVGAVFERRTEWQEAWARFRTGASTVDYVRPSGTGPDALLLNVGQAGRPGRGWWRNILDQYGADDVAIPVVRIYRQYPGGPVVGVFEARFGPDNQLLSRFVLKVGNGDGLPQLLDAGVQRIDAVYQSALRMGLLRPDPGLSFNPNATPTPTDTPAPEATEAAVLPSGGAINAFSVQYDTPSAASVANFEGLMRSLPGIRSADTTSLALGGTSVLRVSGDSPIDAVATALRARGYQVDAGQSVLRVRRPALPPPPGADGGGPQG